MPLARAIRHPLLVMVTLALLTTAGVLADDATKWRPLWDGKTFDGWHKIGNGEWKVADGAIVGTNSASEPNYGHLVSDAAYGDFSVRLKFKSIRGNSGLYFRIEEAGFSGVTGFQAEIDPQNDVGGLYETNGRAWVVQPTAEEVKQYFKPQDWNEMTVTAEGTKIRVEVNGKKSAEIDDPKGRKLGKLALQVHGGQDVEVMFKDIEILGDVIAEPQAK